MTLSDIIARLESGESGWKIDAAIDRLLATPPPTSVLEYRASMIGDGAQFRCRHGGQDWGSWWSVPRYSESLDAAASLVPEGWFWQVKRGFGYEAIVWHAEYEDSNYGRGTITAPCALCIAALKARQAMAQDVPARAEE